MINLSMLITFRNLKTVKTINFNNVYYFASTVLLHIFRFYIILDYLLEKTPKLKFLVAHIVRYGVNQLGEYIIFTREVEFIYVRIFILVYISYTIST